MPRIFDNIEQQLLPALCDTLKVSERADFCVGYFNLRGWKQIDHCIEQWSGGEGHCCRLLVGMPQHESEELREALGLARQDLDFDQRSALLLKKRLAASFREQLTYGVPTNADEAGLRRLAAQIRAHKVVVKLHLRHPLHAKLYLLFRPDPVNPKVGFVGSSNLTKAGLSKQGELNVDVMDHDACDKLAAWFEARWTDHWCIDISEELAEIIERSWARQDPIPPYHIYVKIAYHLSQEARAGLTEFRIPRDFGNRLFKFQVLAVKLAARHLRKRGGVLIGDVVGLGKTLMATALARIFEDDHDLETLVICPKNLTSMWEDYLGTYRSRGKVMSTSVVLRELPELRRYRLVVLDESHNLRNPEGKTYRAIQEYIEKNDSKVILLTATPYNKTFLDLYAQLRLFVPEDEDIGIRPEAYLRQVGELEFNRKHQCSARSMAAFQHSEQVDDWRELMRLYMVRRTRSFIKEHHALTDPATGRKCLRLEDGTLLPFPDREPKTLKFKVDDKQADDQYAKLYAQPVVDIVNGLFLPRYGLGNYIAARPHEPPTPTEDRVLKNLSRAGKRLKGFCRTNLFKRLESSGAAFLQSVRRHILRNYVYLHALDQGLPLPIGTQDIVDLDPRTSDKDADAGMAGLLEPEDRDTEERPVADTELLPASEKDFRSAAAKAYDGFRAAGGKRFHWLKSSLFDRTLTADLRKDIEALMKVLACCPAWVAAKDTKLDELERLISSAHRNDKILVFSQFADTVEYLQRELQRRGIQRLAGVTGDADNPTALAWRFSPVSNDKRDKIPQSQELRVLVATDVLSEGQNLQDCHIVVNYDLPWAIIRLIQRAGRVDRIGQKAEKITCYTFLPADGVDRVLRLRQRVRQRLHDNAEVVGTDEAFFDDDRNDQAVRDLFTEKADILNGEDDTEVDLASKAYQIWQNAIKQDPKLEKLIPDLPAVVFSARQHEAKLAGPTGVLVYMRTADDNDALAWIDENGKSVTESQFEVLKAAECAPDCPALPRADNHHELVSKGADLIVSEERQVGGQLGRPSGARYRAYDRLTRYAESVKGTLLDSQPLKLAIQDIYRYPLRQNAVDAVNRILRTGGSDEELAQTVQRLWEEDRLSLVPQEGEEREPHIICSLGLRRSE